MSVITPGRNLVLTGLMGSGKSTVGRLVADALGRPFVDTDEVVEAEARRSIFELFADEGERGFRAHEAAAVRQVSAVRGQVIALGGGAVVDPANVTLLRMTGDLVWLDASPEALAERIDAEEVARRPLLEGDDLVGRLSQLAEQRRLAYERAAAVTVTTDGRAPEDIAAQILDWAATRPGLLARDERPEAGR